MPPSRAQDLQKKPRQHHVWQEYLRAWQTDGRVWCLQDGRVFSTGTAALGMQIDFYKLQTLTSADLKLIHLLAIDKAHPLARRHHLDVLERILAPPTFVSRHRLRLSNLPLIDARMDVHNTNAIDDHHTMIEGLFLPLLRRTLAGDIDWYDDTDSCIRFCDYIGAQQLRTRGAKAKTIERIQERQGVDLSRIWDILVLLFAFNTGVSLFLERARRRLVLVRNETDEAFVTSDQPVVNLEADGEAAPTHLSFFYPISPRLALYLGEPGEGRTVVDDLDLASVKTLNLKVAQAAYRQRFAQREEDLSPFL